MTQKGTLLSPKGKLTAFAAAALLALVAPTAANAQMALVGQPRGGPSSAFALSASGLLAVEPVAALDGRGGFRQTSVASALLPDARTPVLSVGVLNSEVDDGRARASVKDLEAQLGSLKLPGDFGTVTAEAVDASCVDGEGRVTLAGAKVGAVALEVQPGPDTGVELPGLLSVVLNKQTRAADGTLTVVAISVEVAGLQKIDVASATCGTATGRTTAPVPTDSDSARPSTTNPAASAPGKAPRPTPVEGHLAVTG